MALLLLLLGDSPLRIIIIIIMTLAFLLEKLLL